MSETDSGAITYLRVPAVAKRIGSSPSKVRLLIHRRELAAERDGERGIYLIPEHECERYLADRRSRAVA